MRDLPKLPKNSGGACFKAKEISVIWLAAGFFDTCKNPPFKKSCAVFLRLKKKPSVDGVKNCGGGVLRAKSEAIFFVLYRYGFGDDARSIGF